MVFRDSIWRSEEEIRDRSEDVGMSGVAYKQSHLWNALLASASRRRIEKELTSVTDDNLDRNIQLAI
jgi:hypothetical protein